MVVASVKYPAIVRVPLSYAADLQGDFDEPIFRVRQNMFGSRLVAALIAIVTLASPKIGRVEIPEEPFEPNFVAIKEVMLIGLNGNPRSSLAILFMGRELIPIQN